MEASNIKAAGPSPVLRTLGTLAGIVLGCVFLLAGFAKIIDPARFLELIEAENLTLGMPAQVVAYVGIALEMFLGAALVLGARRMPILLGSLALVLFFVVLSTMAFVDYKSGNAEEGEGCGCFGALIERTPEEAFYLDLALLPLCLLTFVGRAPAGSPWPKARLGLATAVTLASLGITAVAPDIEAFDSIATKLKVGVKLDEICAGEGEDKVCLSDMVPDWQTMTWLVVISEPFNAEIDDPMNAYYDWHYDLDDPDSAPELFWLHRPVTEDEEGEFKFPSDGRNKPKAENQDVPGHFLRGLYRRLPRVSSFATAKSWRSGTDFRPSTDG